MTLLLVAPLRVASTLTAEACPHASAHDSPAALSSQHAPSTPISPLWPHATSAFHASHSAMVGTRRGTICPAAARTANRNIARGGAESGAVFARRLPPPRPELLLHEEVSRGTDRFSTPRAFSSRRYMAIFCKRVIDLLWSPGDGSFAGSTDHPKIIAIVVGAARASPLDAPPPPSRARAAAPARRSILAHEAGAAPADGAQPRP